MAWLEIVSRRYHESWYGTLARRSLYGSRLLTRDQYWIAHQHCRRNTEKISALSLSLFQIRSHTDLTALIEHKAGIYGPRPQTSNFESLRIV